MVSVHNCQWWWPWDRTLGFIRRTDTCPTVTHSPDPSCMQCHHHGYERFISLVPDHNYWQSEWGSAVTQGKHRTGRSGGQMRNSRWRPTSLSLNPWEGPLRGREKTIVDESCCVRLPQHPGDSLRTRALFSSPFVPDMVLNTRCSL